MWIFNQGGWLPLCSNPRKQYELVDKKGYKFISFQDQKIFQSEVWL
jgi:hypothetical protein